MIYQTFQIPTKQIFDPGDMGKAVVFEGGHFNPPYFFDNRNFKMMQPWSDKFVHIKTFSGEVFQFMLTDDIITRTNHTSGMIMTSTLEDTYEFLPTLLSIEAMHTWATHQFKRKVKVKGSYSGYSCSGLWNIKQYERLIPHLKEQGIYFSDEVLENIYAELKRRENL